MTKESFDGPIGLKFLVRLLQSLEKRKNKITTHEILVLIIKKDLIWTNSVFVVKI